LPKSTKSYRGIALVEFIVLELPRSCKVRRRNEQTRVPFLGNFFDCRNLGRKKRLSFFQHDREIASSASIRQHFQISHSSSVQYSTRHVTLRSGRFSGRATSGPLFEKIIARKYTVACYRNRGFNGPGEKLQRRFPRLTRIHATKNESKIVEPGASFTGKNPLLAGVGRQIHTTSANIKSRLVPARIFGWQGNFAAPDGRERRVARIRPRLQLCHHLGSRQVHYASTDFA